MAGSYDERPRKRSPPLGMECAFGMGKIRLISSNDLFSGLGKFLSSAGFSSMYSLKPISIIAAADCKEIASKFAIRYQNREPGMPFDERPLFRFSDMQRGGRNVR